MQAQIVTACKYFFVLGVLEGLIKLMGGFISGTIYQGLKKSVSRQVIRVIKIIVFEFTHFFKFQNIVNLNSFQYKLEGYSTTYSQTGAVSVPGLKCL